MASEECFPVSGGWAAVAIAIVLGTVWALYCINARFGFVPAYISRVINNKSFLAEYERRQDQVVLHELRKRYRIGKKLGEGVTAQVFRIQERGSGTFFALKKIRLKGSRSLEKAVVHCPSQLFLCTLRSSP